MAEIISQTSHVVLKLLTSCKHLIFTAECICNNVPTKSKNLISCVKEHAELACHVARSVWPNIVALQIGASSRECGWGGGGGGGGGTNISCQLKFWPFVSCQLNDY